MFVSGDVVVMSGRFCHRAAPSFLFRTLRAVLCACPHRKAPIGVEHALSCLTVQLTFGPGFVLLVCLFAIVCLGVGLEVDWMCDQRLGWRLKGGELRVGLDVQRRWAWGWDWRRV